MSKRIKKECIVKVIEKYEDLKDVKKHISDDVDEKELQTIYDEYTKERESK
jgi:hypothetical protein